MKNGKPKINPVRRKAYGIFLFQSEKKHDQRGYVDLDRRVVVFIGRNVRRTLRIRNGSKQTGEIQ